MLHVDSERYPFEAAPSERRRRDQIIQTRDWLVTIFLQVS